LPLDSPLWFSPEQPSNNDKCVNLLFKKGWNDVGCDHKIPFACADRRAQLSTNSATLEDLRAEHAELKERLAALEERFA